MVSVTRKSLSFYSRSARAITTSHRSPGTTRFVTTCGAFPNQKAQDAQRHASPSRRRYHGSGQHSGSQYSKPESIPVLSFFFGSIFGLGSDDSPDLTPFKYTKHRVLSVKRISPQHVLVDIQVSEKSRAAFGNAEPGEAGNLDIWHVYVKSPDLQIERPYTPINDVEKDGYIRLLVKRVKGGEVGRYLHSLEDGDNIEIRGPIRTVSVPVEALDYITMISTGTGVAPFLQLICKMANATGTPLQGEPISASSTKLPKISLIQYLPRNSRTTFNSASSTSTASQPTAVSESLPVEEFDSTTDAGPDIIRHPDVLSPIIRKQLTMRGALRLLRVLAGQNVDQSLLVDSLTATRDAEQASLASNEAEQTTSAEAGSWFGWLSSSRLASTSTTDGTKKTVEDAKLQDGKIDGHRVGVMACLPPLSLIPLAGPQYPMGRTKPPIAGVLGRIGFDRSNVWIL